MRGILGRKRSRLVIVACLSATLALMAPLPGNAYERPGTYHIASVNSRGEVPTQQSCGNHFNPAVSPDGRFIAFASSAENLDARHTEQMNDTYVHDTKTGRTSMVSLSSQGTPGKPMAVGLVNDGAGCKGGSLATAISSNGRFVAFTSNAVGLTSELDLNRQEDVFLHDRDSRTTVLLTRSSLGATTASAGGGKSGVSISGNGRYIAFSSNSADLAGDEPACAITQVIGCILHSQVYVYDRIREELKPATVTAEGDPGNGNSDQPSISRNGRWLAFDSYARNLVDKSEQRPADTCGIPIVETMLPPLVPPVIGGGSCLQVFLHDLRRGKTFLVSTSDQGPANSGARLIETNQTISGNGRFVTYASGATNLVPNNPPGEGLDVATHQSVFVYDHTTKRVERVSVSSEGEPFYFMNRASMSADGRHVAYYRAQTLTRDWGIYVHDRHTGALDAVISKRPAPSKQIIPLAISGDGRHVAFESLLSMVQKDTNEHEDIYVRDRGPILGVGGFGGEGSAGTDASGGLAGLGTMDGGSVAGDVTPSLAHQGADLIGARLVHRPTQGDLFGVLELEDMPHAVSGMFSPAAVVQGMRLKLGSVVYEVRAGTPFSEPMILLFRCSTTGPCSKIADLEGGYGTTGERIVFSLPVDLIGLTDLTTIEAAEAWTSFGSILSDPVQVLDSISLS